MKKLFSFLAMMVCLLLAVPMVVRPAYAASTAVAAAGETINVNTATGAQLQTLPGIGKVVAERIVAYRAEKGAFASVEDLLKVKGVGKATLEKIRDRIAVR